MGGGLSGRRTVEGHGPGEGTARREDRAWEESGTERSSTVRKGESSTEANHARAQRLKNFCLYPKDNRSCWREGETGRG